jgi:hypothetical protein
MDMVLDDIYLLDQKSKYLKSKKRRRFISAWTVFLLMAIVIIAMFTVSPNLDNVHKEWTVRNVLKCSIAASYLLLQPFMDLRDDNPTKMIITAYASIFSIMELEFQFERPQCLTILLSFILLQRIIEFGVLFETCGFCLIYFSRGEALANNETAWYVIHFILD